MPGKRPRRKRHFELTIPPWTRVVGFGSWAKDQGDVDFRIPDKDPRRRPPERPEDPEERRRR